MGKKYLNPGNMKPEIVITDNIVYSVQKDLEGNSLELKMSIMQQKEGFELKLAAGIEASSETEIRPALLWIPGGGWRGIDKNSMLAEMVQFARAGYIVASMYYRSSAQGHWPDQIIDVKTAIRFLRAHAAEYNINPERIGVFGRSAGGHLSSFAAMNEDIYTDGEWAGYSSKVSCCCDMFGPVDLVAGMELEEKKFSDPKFRWHKFSDTHGGALLGGGEMTMKERAAEASPVNHINPDMCPILILHGTDDPLVPAEVSSDIFYRKMEEANLEDKIEYYVLTGGGHGSREYWQDSIKEIMIEFFDKYLK